MTANEILEKLNVKYEELTEQERSTYKSWVDILESQPLSVDDIKNYIVQMRDAVSLELVDTPEFEYVLFLKIPNRKHVSLKARLKNYLLLEALLTSREKARARLEVQLRSKFNK